MPNFLVLFYHNLKFIPHIKNKIFTINAKFYREYLKIKESNTYFRVDKIHEYIVCTLMADFS